MAVDKLLNLELSQVKHVAFRALAFCNVTTNRSFAAVVSGKRDRGFTTNTHNGSAGRSKVFNTDAVPFVPSKQTHRRNFCESYGGGARVLPSSGLQDTSPTGESASLQYSSLAGESPHLQYSSHTAHRSVAIDQVFKIPCANRFHLLTNMEPDDTETQNDLGFEPRSRSGPTNSGFLSEDQLPVTKHASMVNTVALKDYRVDASDVVGGLNPVDEQQPGIAACTEFRMSTKQLGSSFGCIPLTPMLLYQGSHKAWQEVPGILQAHRMIRDSGLPNFLGLRIPGTTNLKIASWRAHLCDYFDKQLCDLIEFGFPLDFDRSRHLESTLVNHASARNFSDHIDKYLQEELEFEAILGPFDHPPIQMHISPFMTREKSGSDSRRAIIDLSFPKGSSVNDGVAKNFYLGTEFQMHYPSVDSIIRTLKNLGPSAKIFKVDISRAFRQLKVDPGDIDLLGLQHRDQLYLDLSLPFAYRLGSFFFSKISDSIRFIMAKNGHNALLNYIDDLIYCGLPSNINQSYEFLLNLLQDLGLDISYKKLCPPDTKVICLGILFNTVDRTISIPTDKLSEIVKVCDDWSDKKTVTKNQLQSLLGLLLYISKCVKPARFFLNRMLQLLRDNFENDSIVLTSEFFETYYRFRLSLSLTME